MTHMLNVDIEKSRAQAYASMPASYIANYIYCTKDQNQVQILTAEDLKSTLLPEVVNLTLLTQNHW